MTWLAGWAYRKKLTVDGVKVEGDLTNFPLFITLASGVGLSSTDVTDVFDELINQYTITAAWNPSDKAAGITLSNGNLTAERSGGTSWQAVRNVAAKSSGKWYWETTINVAADNNFIIGIGTSSENLTYPGSSANGYGYNGASGQKYAGGSGYAYGSAYTLGDVISTALDLDSGKIWWAKNGVWQGSGNPVLGTNAAWTNVVGTFYPMIGIYANTNKATDNFGASSFVYTPPAGFTAFSNAYTDNTKKIAVTTSGGAQCYVEIESWDWVKETASLWVKVPSLLTGVNTELYLYYDVAHADNTAYVGDTASLVATNVWDSSFMGVWHMNKKPTGTESIKDSTSNTRHMTSAGLVAGDLYDGEVGKCIYFDSTDNLSRTAPSIPGSWTCEAWLNPSSSSTYDRIVTIAGDGLAMEGSPVAWCVLTGNNMTEKSHAVVNGSYIYVAGVKDGSTYYIYENGVEYSYSASNPGWGMADLRIGGPGYGSNYFNGYMDEVRVSNIARPQAWVRANHYSMKDDLISFGATENEARWYFSGYVKELATPVSRQIYVYRRDTGELVGATTSSGDGHYYLETAYSGAQFIVALDDESGASYNMARLDKMIPATI